MHYSPILVLVLITILSLSGAYSERYPRDYRKSNYESPLNDEPQDEVLDIGNGNYRKNVIVMEPGNSQPNPLDCHGSTCEDVKVYLSKNGAAKTNQAFSLLLSSLSIFYLVLI
ncbi:uncharacterized protein LOC123866399 isoform X8 [Maniola jurtina]|uniref:uncharacterized protein LOC123866399 isoform X8 n=1 Tax=Maniola jurtina TaxID=191418 RepID=UPI001E68F470|nr:uncharacterized protein LOC123866399 isoform X8 [Maniola jurtina]